jgi:5-formyltetrahydrofolate cyclo-ligase
MIPDLKEQLRLELQQKRDDYMKSRELKGIGKAILDKLIATAIIPSDAVIGSYWPVKSEVDVRPLLSHFYKRGHKCGLPIVQAQNKPLVFREWSPGELLVSGLYNILTPDDNAPLVNPTVLFIPVLGFDRQGHRLGHGEGYYDRTLETLRADHPIIAIGIAYDCQEVDSIPYEHFDQRLNYIITPTQIIEIKE